MMNPQAPQGAPAPEGAPQGEPAQGDMMTQMLFGVGDALTQVGEATAKSGIVPPEAMSDLEAATSAYQSFLSKVGEAIGAPAGAAKKEAPMGAQPAETMGAKGAVPAGMPSGKNVKAVPAY